MSEPPVLVLARGRDSTLTAQVLARTGHRPRECASVEDLIASAPEAGAVVIAEELLHEGAGDALAGFVAAQPPWSDLPIVVVEHDDRARRGAMPLARLGNVSVLRRPMTIEALVSVVGSALRARMRQLQVRDLLAEQEANARRKDQFLAMLAHELRNPLAPVRYAARALALPGLPPRQIQELTGMLERQVEHMSRIISDLLDVSRLARGLTRIEREPIDLARLARNSAQAYRAAAGARGLSIVVDERAKPWISGDPTRVKQALDNLLDNAIKFSASGGEVRVVVGRAGGWAELAVVDDGEGIAADLLPALFEPFSQGDRSLDRGRGGLGLGLALVRGLVALHDGEVDVASDGPGRGSRFCMRFPAIAAPGVAVAPVAAPQVAPRENARLRVLVVEDNQDAASALGHLLELCGHDVTIVHSGSEGLEAVRRGRPDIVLCDVGLPGFNGYEVARAIQRELGAARPRLVAVTGYGSADDRAEAYAAGFDLHLAKPVDPEILLRHVATTSPLVPT